ncbi:MAG: tRNA pseudouridine(13) synthase TruD [Pseudomonadales bacterium]|nr:tRNA pseudouridine(13) synthase TruD [Pseudomonadales bacterium]
MMSLSTPMPVQDGTLAYAYGRPRIIAGFKQVPEDFQVEEELGFGPSGKGEHLFVQVRKTALTSKDVLERLSQYFQVSQTNIGYAGMKDKQGVCSQWFSICLPGRLTPDLLGLNAAGLEVLAHGLNHRKLRQGTHKANHFSIRLRGVHDPDHELEQRLHWISQKGVPNYYGEQRFGRSGENLSRARALFEGRLKCSRYQRGILLSAARAAIFNRILDARVAAANWQTWLPGDVLNLQGSRSVFASGEQDDGFTLRLEQGDIHVTGALWGRGEPASSFQAGELERAVASELLDLCRGLEAFGLQQDRRSLCLPVQGLECSTESNADLILRFSLPPGGYATAVLRELFQYRQDTEQEATM